MKFAFICAGLLLFAGGLGIGFGIGRDSAQSPRDRSAGIVVAYEDGERVCTVEGGELVWHDKLFYSYHVPFPRRISHVPELEWSASSARTEARLTRLEHRDSESKGEGLCMYCPHGCPTGKADCPLCLALIQKGSK